MQCFMTKQLTGKSGPWNSPVTGDSGVAVSVHLSDPRIDGGDIYWIEARPLEMGRNVVVRAAGGSTRDVTPAPFSARSQVYGYGGGAYAVHGGVVYFVNLAPRPGDNQIYRQAPGNAPTKITSNPPTTLFADICVDAKRNRLIAIREVRPNGDGVNAINTLVAV